MAKGKIRIARIVLKYYEKKKLIKSKPIEVTVIVHPEKRSICFKNSLLDRVKSRLGINKEAEFHAVDVHDNPDLGETTYDV